MTTQELSVTKKMGRPRKEPTTVVRLPSSLVEAADTWASEQSDLPPRPEAIRRLVEKGLRAE
jgi:hypothetical protein